MAIRDLPTTDGLPTCEVETAEELTARLVPGVYVRAPREVLAACGWGDTENADTAEIVAGADWRDDAWIAQGVAPWQKPWQPGPHVPVAPLHTTRPSTPRQRRS